MIHQVTKTRISKANPTGSQVHVDRPLTDISVAFIQDSTQYVAEDIFPKVNVKQQGNLYYIYNKGDMFRVLAEKRAPGSASAGGGFKLETNPYFADVWGFHQDVSYQDQDNADDPLNPLRDSSEFVTQILMIRREIEFFGSFFAASIWTTDFTPATLWDAGGSNPITDVDDQIVVLTQLTGKSKNSYTFTMSLDVWSVVKNHVEVLDRIKYTQKGVVTEEILASLWGIKTVKVSQAIKNDAAEGAADDMQFIATPKSALLSYSPPRAGLKQPSAGYVINWSGFRGAGSAGSRISTFPMRSLSSDRVEGEMAFDMKLVSADCAVFFDTIIS